MKVCAVIGQGHFPGLQAGRGLGGFIHRYSF
jgi:hypothetical protein